MLGERRSNSLFVPAAPAEPERNPEQAEVHDISFEERTGRSLFAEASTAPRASELFFAPQEKGVTFAEALSQVQSYLSETYATLITEDNSDAKEQMKRRMARYLQENRIAVDGMTASELVDALYTEMAEYGFLTKYIFADGIEEIDINSWRDIEIQYSDGHTAKLEEHFDSPEHAANVIRRMLQNSGKVLDNASPIITSRLAKNIRISVIKTPVLDEDAGVAASIRIVNPRNLSKADFVQSGTATEEMLDFLSACLRYGVSICVAGATSSGKTTVAALLAATLRAAGIHAGLYHAGCEPLSVRVRVDGAPVDEGLLCLAAEAQAAAEPLPQDAAELAAAAYAFGKAGCALAVVELPDAGLASALPQMPVCAVTSVGPDGVSRSVERLAALAAGVMRKGSICVTAPEQPKAVLSELIVAAGKCDCELVVPDPEDITFLEAEKFASKVDYGGYTVPLAFLGRHAAGNAAMAVELALALCRKGFDIPDEAILDGLAAVENRSSIRVISQRPLVILDACRTPQQASALLRVLNMAKVRHMSAIIGLAEEEGAEAFFSALETGLTPEEQKKDKSTMPGMSENPFDKVYLVTPAGGDDEMTARLTEKAKYHFDAEMCTSIAEAVELAHANTRRGLLVCGGEAAALEAAELLVNS